MSSRSRSRAVVLAGCLAFVALACAGGGNDEPVPDRLDFVDSQIFEDQLRKSLAADHPRVQVAIRGTDATVNDLPERIDLWLQSIAKRNGGRVDVLPDPEVATSRGLEAVALSFVMGAYSFIREASYYWPAREYNATVYYQPGPGTLTRIVFTRVPDAS